MEGKFVFCTMPEKTFVNSKFDTLMSFKESEGRTVVVEKDIAEENNLRYEGIWSLITLTVKSDLFAVGFLAVVTDKLAKNGITVNSVSAYYHDHLLVPVEKAKLAIELLEELIPPK